LYLRELGELSNREAEVPAPNGSNDAGGESGRYQQRKNMIAAAPAAPKSQGSHQR